MGDLIPFRKRPRPKKTWTRPEDYAKPGGKPPRGRGGVLPESTWRGTRAPSRLRRFWNAARWWIGIVLIATAWVLWRDGHLFAPRALEGAPIAVSGGFTRCGPARLGGPGERCVVDGDSLRIGSRDLRLVGIDAPELHGQCPAESALAERAAQGLLGWVNAGPFELVPRLDRPTDKYGRELVTARRTVAAGQGESAADVLIAQGLARPYSGEARKGWC